MRKIDVKYNDFRNWEERVNVVVREDDSIVWCNHVDTYLDDVEINSAIKFVPKKVEVCEHCDAWRDYPDGEWVRD